MMCDDLNLEAGVRPLSLCLGALFCYDTASHNRSLKKSRNYIKLSSKYLVLLMKFCWFNLLARAVSFFLVCAIFCILPHNRVMAAEDARPSVEVEITGVEGKLLDNIKGYLRLLQKRDDPNFNINWLKFLHKEAPDDIRKALEPFGYFKPQIDLSLEKIDENKWKATYRVVPGPRVVISDIDIKLSGEGADDPSLKELVEKFPLKKGDVLDQGVYEKAKKELIVTALSKGYVDVHPTVKQLLVDPEENTVAIRLHIDTGPRYYIGDIRIHQDFLKPDLVRSYIKDIQKGQVFTNTTLLELQQELSNTGFFSLVDVVPDFENARDRLVPVDITLYPADANKLTFGFGYDTQVGPQAMTHWSNRRLNSYGHSMDAWVNVSPLKNSFRGAYWIPAGDPRTDRYGIITKVEQEETDDTDRNTADLEGGYYFVWHDWSSKLFTEAKLERFRTKGNSWTRTKMLSFGGRLERSSFPRDVFPRSGWYLYSELRGSPGLISDTAYVREHLRTRLFLPAGQRGRFILRGRLGLAGVSDYDSYPNSLRFFAGGDESVRGYRWKELGPKDKDGDVVGGRNVMSATAEYNYRVLDKWVAALFADAGNAFNSSLDKIYVGTGLGVRWLSPVGSVRLDFAWPVNEDGRGMKLSSMKFYFGFEITM